MKPFYVCSECKKIVSEINDLYFVEELNARSFCSDSCIEDFYGPIVDYFEKKELDYREELDLFSEEKFLSYLDEDETVLNILFHPDEVYLLENELQEKIFTYHKKITLHEGEEFYGIIVAKVYDYTPSFVFHSTLTRDLRLKRLFQWGKAIPNLQDFIQKSHEKMNQEDPMQEDSVLKFVEEISNEVELKKSEILAQLLEKIDPQDIQFNEYMIYSSFMDKTLEDPDEIYELEDNGEDYVIYIKTCEKDNLSFYYIVYALVKEISHEKQSAQIIPLLGIPTTDPKLYRFFQQGEVVTKNTIN